MKKQEKGTKFTTQIPQTQHGVLAKLWRNIVTERGINSSMDYLVGRYVEESLHKDANTPTTKRRTKAMLIKDIVAPELSWKKLCHLVFSFLKAVRMDVTIKLTYANGEKSYHNISVTNANTQEEKDRGAETDATKTKGSD